MIVGKEYRIKWVDAAVYQSVMSPADLELGHQVAMSWGRFYGYKVVEGKKLALLSTTDFADTEHGDYILIPIGCIAEIKELR